MVRRAPVVEVGAGLDVGRRQRPVGRERDAIRDRRTVADRARRPRARAGLEHPAAARVGDQERREVRLVVVVLAAAALAVLGERARSSRRARRRRCAPRSRPSRTRSMPRSPAVWRRRIVDRPDPLVADRDAVLVDAVLDAPEPRRVRADERVRAGVGDPEVLRVERAARLARARCASTTCASPGGRSEFFANTMPGVRAQAQRVAHGRRSSTRSAEPDALVVAAHRVQQQRRRARRRR